MSLKRYKSRVVAKGFDQTLDIDYIETFSPVVKHTTIRVVLTLILFKGCIVRKLNVNNAFLNGDITDEEYVEQLEGFMDTTKLHHVCNIRKALYGVK